MAATQAVPGILDDERTTDREHIVELLTKAYWMEIDTVMNYLAASINPDGIRAQQIARTLAEDVEEELGHARLFGRRIKELYGVVPSSVDFPVGVDDERAFERQTDTLELIKAVIRAESEAVEHYNLIVRETEEADPVTQDMVIEILHDEERHRRLFEGFQREYESDGRM